jgi:hypothetical protein
MRASSHCCPECSVPLLHDWLLVLGVHTCVPVLLTDVCCLRSAAAAALVIYGTATPCAYGALSAL